MYTVTAPTSPYRLSHVCPVARIRSQRRKNFFFSSFVRTFVRLSSHFFFRFCFIFVAFNFFLFRFANRHSERGRRRREKTRWANVNVQVFRSGFFVLSRQLGWVDGPGNIRFKFHSHKIIWFSHLICYCGLLLLLLQFSCTCVRLNVVVGLNVLFARASRILSPMTSRPLRHTAKSIYLSVGRACQSRNDWQTFSAISPYHYSNYSPNLYCLHSWWSQINDQIISISIHR